MSPKSAFTPQHIDDFLSYINLPKQFRNVDTPRDISLLTALHVHMVAAVPYENLTLHYSSQREPSLEPLDIYNKVVTNARGRGGYCMENALLLLHTLRGLGFQAYTAGVRIRLRQDGVPAGDFTGWVHVVIIVTLDDNSKWMVDVSFGGDGPTKPMEMISGKVLHNLGTQEIRLVHDHIPEQTVRTERSKLWIYQYRNGPDREWNTFYAFPEFEFLPKDFSVMNWYTGPWGKSPQKSTVLIIKFLGRKNDAAIGGLDIYGKRMLVQGIIKENLTGKTVVVQECKSEEERVSAIQELFGITLLEEEKLAIGGWAMELKPETAAVV